MKHDQLIENQNKNNMSAEERLTQARQLRQQQVQRWHEAEVTVVNGNETNEDGENTVNNNKTTSLKHVKFGNNITLLEAAARDDLTEVRKLLKSNVDPNEANEDGLTALHQACIDNFDDLVQLLIEFNANVNATDSEQWTPLHAACTCGHTKIAQILITKGANLLALNADHNMPYDICEEDETLEAVEKAMAAQGITQEQINSMRSAQEREILNDLQQLVKDNQSINFKDKHGATVLHVAAANGYADLAKFILKNGGEVNAVDDDGWTPLHAAACWCQTDLVELLGEENADPGVKNNLGEIASDVTDEEEIKTLLLKIKTERGKRQRKFPRFPKLPSRYGSKRSSGIRGRSFKGRSQRDSNKFATLEAKSEAQYWATQEDQDDTDDSVPSKSVKEKHHQSTLHNTSNNKTQSNGGARDNENSHERAIDCDIGIADSIKVKNNIKTKEKKKAKKSKKSPAPLPPPSDTSDEATNSASGLLKVTNSIQQYNLSEENGTATNNNSQASAHGEGTLSELKKRRASETKPDVDDNAFVVQSYSADDIKHFKGSTGDDIIGLSKKKASCIIL